MSKRTLILAAACLFLVSSPAWSADVVKIGYVNMQKALENSAAGREATKKLNDVWEGYKDQLETEKKALETLKEEIDKQAMLWNEKTRREKETEMRRLERDYARLLKDTKDEITGREAELSATIGKEILRLIEEIGREGGYTIVLEKTSSAILYAPNSIDITDQVIKAYDAQKQ